MSLSYSYFCFTNQASFLCSNYAGNDNNGGAIRANKDSNVEIEYSTMTRNEGFLGGAIYTLGNMRILQTVFTDNVARVAVSTKTASTKGVDFCTRLSLSKSMC